VDKGGVRWKLGPVGRGPGEAEPARAVADGVEGRPSVGRGAMSGVG
jgi:hypothetical protein